MLSEVLASSGTALQKLILSGNLIDDDAIKALAEGLGRNKSLTTLVYFINQYENKCGDDIPADVGHILL